VHTQCSIDFLGLIWTDNCHGSILCSGQHAFWSLYKTADSKCILIIPCKENNFQTKVVPNSSHCPCEIQEYLCFDLQELDSVYWVCRQPAYCSKTEAWAIVWNKRIHNRKQDEFVPHKSSCNTTKSGLYAADMVAESSSTTSLLSRGRNALQMEVIHVVLMSGGTAGRN